MHYFTFTSHYILSRSISLQLFKTLILYERIENGLWHYKCVSTNNYLYIYSVLTVLHAYQ